MAIGCAPSSTTIPHKEILNSDLFGEGPYPKIPTLVVAKEGKDLGHLRDQIPRSIVSSFPAIKESGEFLIVITPGYFVSTGYEMKLDPIRWDPALRSLHISIQVLTPEETNSGGDPAFTYLVAIIGLSNKYLPTSVTCTVDGKNIPYKTWLNGYPDWATLMKQQD